jgi:hypothetical protein
MQGHKMKKFTHNRMKACIERSEDDKENRLLPDANKKFSVELPSKHSESSASDPHKSIFNEQISVTLNAANPRPYDKEQISLDIKSLTHLLAKQRRDSPPLREILHQEAQDVKSIEVRLLISRMLDKLTREDCDPASTSMASEQESHVLLSESLVRPIIEKELEVLERNYQMLQHRYSVVKRIKEAPHEDKLRMLSRMREIERAQLQELAEIEQLS